MTIEPTVSDSDLVNRVQAGGADAQVSYEALVTRHQSWLVRYLQHLLRSSADADDVAQEVFLQAYLAINRLRQTEQYRAWLRKIATRSAFNYQRSRRRRQKYEEQAEGPSALPLPGNNLADAQAVSRVMEQMSYPFREVLVLRHLEEMSVAEIAAALNIGSSAAKMRLKRAREEFFAIYSRMVDDDRSSR